MLLILNLPLIGVWVRLIQTPYKFLSAFILLFCLIGSYGISHSAYDVIIMTVFGLVGYIAKKTHFELTPMIIGLILGPMLENALRRSLIISNGSFDIFFTRPVSLIFAGITIIFLSYVLLTKKRLTGMRGED
jgi:putative tricarboxylic transport membrane protein